VGAKEHQKKSKYDDSYLQFGFVCVGDSRAPDAQLILCYQILAKSSMVPAKFQRHLCTKNLLQVQTSRFL
jgi:hypothetical protein